MDIREARVIVTKTATTAGVYIPFTALPDCFAGDVMVVPITAAEARFLESVASGARNVTGSQVARRPKD